MRKNKFFNTFLKKVNLLINNLLESNLNKLKLVISFNTLKNNKLIPLSLIIFVLILSYLSLPNLYSKVEIQKKFYKQLNDRFNLKFNLSDDFKYNFFPQPHFIFSDSTILENQLEFVKIKRLKIKISLFDLFSVNNLEIKDIILDNANFDLKIQNYKFFFDLLDQNFKDGIFVIKDSNIFFRNKDGEVLFINKVLNLKYYFDNKKLKNFILSKNEIFNLPYSIKIDNDKIKKKYFSKFDFKFLNLQIENELEYNSSFKKGFAKINSKFNKIISEYEIKENKLSFHVYDNLKDVNFTYKGEVNFTPFFSNLIGNTKKFDPLFFFQSNSLVLQLLKTEILNNKNLNFNAKINSDKIKNFQSFKRFILNSKIYEGFIDLDNTSISWNNHVNFTIIDSLIYVKEGELMLSGKLNLIIDDYNKIYQFLLTPKNYRSEIKKINVNFIYNFDQQTMSLYNIEIDDKTNPKVDNLLNILMFKNNTLQNKIYLKNIFNKAIKAYVG